jgi:preprotein translocase subunit YajC
MNQAQTNSIHFIIQMGLIFLIFYFVLIRPQKMRQAEHRRMLLELKKNDGVITSGGIHGVVVNVKDNTVLVRVDDNVKIEFQKDSIATVKKAQS